MASITRFYALVLSTVLLLSGVPGFFPNIVSFQPLITFFALTLVHAVVHAAVGLLGLLITALASDDAVRIYTGGIALLYGILAAVGLAGVNFAPVLYFNTADNILHGAIFALSLGIFLAAISEERSRQRRERFISNLPDSHWAVPSAPGRLTGVPASRGAVMGPEQGMMTSASQQPWNNQPSRDPQPQNTWSQDPWQQYQQPTSQPSSQPAIQPRDPWTREHRRSPDQYPANSPSQGQYPPAQNPWSQSPWPQSQPPQGPSGPPSQSPWPPDSRPRDARSQPESREQWPLDEWPSLHDSRPSQ